MDVTEGLFMTANMVSIEVPLDLYHRLERLAALTQRPLESLVAQTLASTIPLLPDDLSPATQNALTAIESLSNERLQATVRDTLPEVDQKHYLQLREKRRSHTLTADEQATLDHLTQEADLLTLKKAYAAVLLKWRDQQPPTLAELTPRV